MIILTQNSNIRRIDELGRIVIPKDIRKKLHIKDNEPLEIYIDNGDIRIRKYSSLPDIIEYIRNLIDIGNRIAGYSYIITDREKIIASTNKEFETIPLEKPLEDLVLSCQEDRNIAIDYRIANIPVKGYANIVPIIVDNDRSGLIIEYNTSGEIRNQEVIKIFKNLIETSLNNY